MEWNLALALLVTCRFEERTKEGMQALRVQLAADMSSDVSVSGKSSGHTTAEKFIFKVENAFETAKLFATLSQARVAAGEASNEPTNCLDSDSGSADQPAWATVTEVSADKAHAEFRRQAVCRNSY